MGRGQELTPLERLERRVLKLEAIIKWQRKRFSDVAKRCQDIYHNQKHYLKYRAKKVDKRQRALMNAAVNLEKKLRKIPLLNVKMTAHGKGKNHQRHILMVSNNHARKLRALAEMDLRPLLNSRFNQGKGRKRLSNGGSQGAYKTTE